MLRSAAIDSDPQRQQHYTLDSFHWNCDHRGAEAHVVKVSRAEWTAYAHMLLDDGLARPYPDQIRRRPRPLPLTVRSHPELGKAYAYRSRDMIEVSDDRLKLLVCLHEVTHLLVPNAKRPAHDSRFASVYAHMIRRHVGDDVAGIFLAMGDCLKVAFRPEPTV